jgi:hypothetical protein
VLPKPADLTLILDRALNVGAAKITLEMQEPFRTVLSKEDSAFNPIMVLLSSCGFSVFALWGAAVELARADS